jgi:hypothetical protein
MAVCAFWRPLSMSRNVSSLVSMTQSASSHRPTVHGVRRVNTASRHRIQDADGGTR